MKGLLEELSELDVPVVRFHEHNFKGEYCIYKNKSVKGYLPQSTVIDIEAMLEETLFTGGKGIGKFWGSINLKYSVVDSGDYLKLEVSADELINYDRFPDLYRKRVETLYKICNLFAKKSDGT